MVDNKKPEFLEKFPHGKISAWESPDGFKLFEGVAIARYGEWLSMNLYRDDRRSLDWRIFDSFPGYPSLESRVDLLDDLITFFFFFFGLYRGNADCIKLQWRVLHQTLVFSVDHLRILRLSTNGSISLTQKSIPLPISSVGSV